MQGKNRHVDRNQEKPQRGVIHNSSENQKSGARLKSGTTAVYCSETVNFILLWACLNYSSGLQTKVTYDKLTALTLYQTITNSVKTLGGGSVDLKNP